MVKSGTLRKLLENNVARMPSPPGKRVDRLKGKGRQYETVAL